MTASRSPPRMSKCTFDLVKGKSKEKLRVNGPARAWWINLKEVTTRRRPAGRHFA